MVLRYHHFCRLKDKAHLNRLGAFSIKSSKDQAAATRALYDHLVSADGGDSDRFAAQSMKLLHRLLVSFVHHEIHTAGKMECPTDNSLFLLSLRLSDEGTLRFQTANQLTRDCATMQYWFFTIVAHIARLETSMEGEFMPFRGEVLTAAAETAYQVEAFSSEKLSTSENQNNTSIILQELLDGVDEDQEEEEEDEDEDEDEVVMGEGVEEENNGPLINALQCVSLFSLL